MMTVGGRTVNDCLNLLATPLQCITISIGRLNIEEKNIISIDMVKIYSKPLLVIKLLT